MRKTSNISVKAIGLVAVLSIVLSACNQPQPKPSDTPSSATSGTTAVATESASASATSVPTQGPTATPRPPSDPILVDRQPLRGEELQLDNPIVLTFDQAMDHSSVEKALQVSPKVDGKFTWTSDNVVSFKPAKEWDRAKQYTISLTDTAKSAKGLALARSESFNVSTIGYLEVAQTIPATDAQDVSADSKITVLFNRPVVSLTLIGQQAGLPTPLKIDPPIAGQGEWLNTSIYLFRPTQALTAGITYTGTIAAGLADTTGALLEKDYTFSFKVAPPTVKALSPEDTTIDVDLRRPISITFNQKMDHASAEAAFKITPALKGSFVWTDEQIDPTQAQQSGKQPGPTVGTQPQPQAANGEVMAFTPSEDYQRGTLYAVEIAATAKAVGGESAMAQGRSFSFRTIEVPAVASTIPANGDTKGDPASGFTIRFSAPVLPETIVPNLKFEPAISLTKVYSYYDPSEKRFFLNVDLQPSTRYKVTIGGAIADQYGMKIGADSVVQFTTAPYNPYAVLNTSGQMGTYDASKPTKLFATYRNVSRLDFELSSLTLDQFFQFTGADNAGDNLRQFTPTNEQRIRKWSVQSSAALNEMAFAPVELAANNGSLKPGIYLLTLSAPEAAATIKYYEPARHILIVSNLHVGLKEGEREALAWVTDLDSGKPAADLSVSFRDRTFKEVGKGTTGADGQLLNKFAGSFEEYASFYAIVGQPGEDNFGVAYNRWDNGISPWDFNLMGQFGSTHYTAYLYTERPIYRPGQMVYFKGIVRSEDDARYSLPQGLNSADVTVSNDQGQQVFSSTLPINANGTFSGSFALDNSAPTGYYFIQTCLPGTAPVGYKGNGLNKAATQSQTPPCRSYSVSFQVATYRTPQFEVTLDTDKADYQNGDTFNAALTVKYYSGGNVANAKVQWTLYGRDYFFNRYKGLGNYVFGDYDTADRGVGYNDQVANGSGTTDASGKLNIKVPADISKQRNSATFSLEVSVTDASDQSVSARTEAVVHKSDYYLGIAPQDYVGLAGSEMKFDVLSVDLQGQAVGNKAATVSFYQRQWFTTQEEDQYGTRTFTSVPSDTLVTTATVTTDASGKATAAFTPTEGSEYHVVVAGQAESGPVAGTSVYVSSGGAYVPWRVNNNDRIDLKIDKQEYKVGDVVKLLVPSPFSGTVYALVSVERGRFLTSTVVTLKSNSDILEIPVTESFAPNAFVSVMLVKGIDESNSVPAYKLGYATFNVDAAEFALNVDVKTDKTTYGPRDTVTYDIRVTDAQSKPVQAELSLALVDKAILSLADANSQPIFTAFYGTRGLGIRTSDSLNINVDRITAKIIADNAKGGGGGGLAGALDGLFVRQNFKDTAYWSAVVNTDADGKAQVQITLPDNLTTWSFDARAISSDSKVGQGKNEILATKPLLVSPVTPRFFVVGDALTLGATVNNNTDSDIDAEVALEASGITLANPAPQQVSVKAHSVGRVDWQVTVNDAESAVMTFTVKGGGLQDSSKPSLATAPNGGIPILHYAAPETVATAGDLSEAGKKVELIALPPRLVTGQGQLDVEVDPALAAVINTGDKALQEEPYESAETTASRLLVSVAVNNASTPDNVTRALQRLLGSQHTDGGWGWWTDDATNNAVTAYVLVALAHARDAGYAVDLNSFTRAREYLLTQLVSVEGQPSLANQQAFFLFALTEAGADDSGRLGTLYENRDALNYAAKAELAMSLEKVNKGDTRVKALLADLTSGAVAGATGVMWQEKENDPALFGNNTRSTAIVLNALARLDPQSAISTNVVRWLMVARQGDTWETNQEIAWAVTGLAAWQTAVGEKDADYTWRVALNGQEALSGQAEASKLAEAGKISVAVSKLLSDQANELIFERGAGSGRMYYTARLKAYLPADEAKAVNRGMVIARKYELADCKPEPGKPCDAVNGAAIGQNVRVRLTIVAPTDMYFVRVTDPFPGGAEAVDTSLKTSQQVGTETTVQEIGGSEGWGWWWFSHAELRDQNAAMFASYLPAGTYEYTYILRPSIAGSFKVIPASVEETYFPETFGRSDGASFTITK
jgi:uncharacterized protein YfaS (alpha-2-macroglobulin family)